MIEEQPDPGVPQPQKKVSFKKIGEFLLGILELERSVKELRSSNGTLRDRLEELQRQLDVQSGQLETMSRFIDKALDDRIEAKAERAALQMVDRLLSIEENDQE